MPKLKTKKAMAKRVKVTKKKKAVRSKAGRRHLLSCKGRKRKRKLRKKNVSEGVLKRLAKKAMPYA